MPVRDEMVAEVNAALEQMFDKSVDNKTEEVKTDVSIENKQDKEDAVSEGNIGSGSDESDGADADTNKDGSNDSSAKVTETEKEVSDVESVSDYALTQAVHSGFSVEEAREFGSDKLLMRAVDRVKKADAMVELIRKQYQPKEEVKEDDPFAAIPDFKPDEFDSPEVAAAFNALKAVAKKQSEELKQLKTTTIQSTEAHKNAEQEAALKDAEMWFDAKINSLGKDFEEALGSGNYGKLTKEVKDNPELAGKLAKRNSIAEQVAVLINGYNATGKQISRDDAFDTASKIVLAEEFQKIKDAKIADGLAKRETQHIQRAGGQKIKPNLSPQEEVAALADDFIKKRRF